MKLWSPLAPVLGQRLIRDALLAAIAARGRPAASAPNATSPAGRGRPPGQATIWAEAGDESGRRALARLDTPGGYPLTAAIAAGSPNASCATASRRLSDRRPALLPDLILDFAGVSRTDLL